jgi:hypothetical protein
MDEFEQKEQNAKFEKEDLDAKLQEQLNLNKNTFKQMKAFEE